MCSMCVLGVHGVMNGCNPHVGTVNQIRVSLHTRATSVLSATEYLSSPSPMFRKSGIRGDPEYEFTLDHELAD